MSRSGAFWDLKFYVGAREASEKSYATCVIHVPDWQRSLFVVEFHDDHGGRIGRKEVGENAEAN